MSGLQSKRGKSKRGQWSTDQKAYADRCLQFGCIACYFGRGIAGTPAQWHHEKERWHGAGMRAPHEFGLPLCEYDHTIGPESVHQNPRAFAEFIGMSEADAVEWCQNTFHWKLKRAA